MIRTISLPSSDYVTRLLGGLLDKEIGVERLDGQFTLQTPGRVGAYVQDDGKVGALCAYDLHLCAYVGAALTLVPLGTATDAIKDKALPEFLDDNVAEILNVSARLFNSPRTPHVTLRAVHKTPGMLPSDAALLLNRAAGQLALAVEVAGYGAGRMWLYVS